ncbi:MAG: hypothetical protein B6I35_01530 [Anaerolineaceae bacterium 4572_32.2]|nr:MAG: hypothetical protein B6I35_01530 [Anaerolineaceae bacterium 4572_32.2]HEY73886.1 response regulator [Thermoflexia bacterium]
MPDRNSYKRGQKQTVLIVDDEESLALAIEATLEQEGLRTVVVHDGDQALETARSQRPDLILLDVMLPSRSGIEVCATLKTDPETSSIPVVLISAKAEPDDRSVGLAAGADEYLPKPFNPIELIALVNEMLAGAFIMPRSVSDIAKIPAEQDQLVIYARELKEVYEHERCDRRALEEARQRLDEVDRLKASFLGVVTHELLTPFADIGLALQVLQQESADAAPGLQVARDELATKIADLYRLINGMVKFAELVGKRREPQPGYISLTRLIPWAVQPVAVMAQARDVDFRVFVPPDLLRVHADPELLSEAVFQMAHNAVKFNLPGGQAHVKVFEATGWVVIEVQDTGVGLTQEQLEALGRPFEQSADALRRGQEGLGLGWTFVCYVAEVHGGQTHVKSAGPGQGSSFSLALPVPEKEPGVDALDEMDVEEWMGGEG